MITNQQIGLRHFTWGGLAVLEFGLHERPCKSLKLTRDCFGLGERFYLLPYQIGVLAAFLHMGNLIARHVQRFVPAGIVEDTFLAIRITAYKAVGYGHHLRAAKRHCRQSGISCLLFADERPRDARSHSRPPANLRTVFCGDRKRYQRAALVGMGPMPKQLRDYVTTCQGFGIRFVGIYGEQSCPELGLPLLGTVRDAEELPDFRPKVHRSHPHLFQQSHGTGAEQGGSGQSLSKGLRVQAYSNVANAFEEPVKITMDGSGEPHQLR